MSESKPWLSEPDTKEFESSGYLCEMQRHPLGAWCGYVTVPIDHPWHGLASMASVTPLGDLMYTERTGVFDILSEGFTESRPVGQIGLSLALDVHGGVTFAAAAARLKGRAEDTGWVFGFDCTHAGDITPGLLRDEQPDWLFAGSVYRDIDYVTGQCARLAAQLRMVERRGSR